MQGHRVILGRAGKENNVARSARLGWMFGHCVSALGCFSFLAKKDKINQKI